MWLNVQGLSLNFDFSMWMRPARCLITLPWLILHISWQVKLECGYYLLNQALKYLKEYKLDVKLHWKIHFGHDEGIKGMTISFYRRE